MINLDESNFTDFVNQELAVVQVFAEWCGPCKLMKPVLERVSLNVGVESALLDIEKHKSLVEEQQIKSIPTFLMYKNGEVVDKKTGSLNELSLQMWIESKY
mgnify:FL=1